MLNTKTTFAVMFGNRGFFPSHLQAAARKQIATRLEELGHDSLMMAANATNHGAIETVDDGKKFADFLRQNKGQYGGVILSLPNFGDELGAAEALKDVDVPVLVQAYPDEMDKMAPTHRRDSFCGKFALCDVLYQYGIKFTVLAPHVVNPGSPEFAGNIEYFDKVCRVHNGLRDMRLLCLGARTTPFKSVRADELALQKHRISVDTCDMSSVIESVRSGELCDKAVSTKSELLKAATDCSSMPEKNFNNLARLAVVIDNLIEEFQADAVTIRCWIELQKQLGVSPCFLNGLLCDKGIPMACEVDVCNAVMMLALQCATGKPSTILDWNNNYGNQDDKCVVFHCGNVPASMLKQKGPLIEHAILAETAGKDCSWGCSNSRIRPMDVTYGSLKTEDGKLVVYSGVGQITADEIPADFFGNAGVLKAQGLQKSLQWICGNGYRHHVSLSEGNVIEPLAEAMEKYLGFEMVCL